MRSSTGNDLSIFSRARVASFSGKPRAMRASRASSDFSSAVASGAVAP